MNLEQEFDEVYAEAMAFRAKHQPCGITSKGCKGNLKTCCGGCKHLGQDGCTAEAIACRLWYCSAAELSKEQATELYKISKRAAKFYVFRGDKTESLRAAKEREGWQQETITSMI